MASVMPPHCESHERAATNGRAAPSNGRRQWPGRLDLVPAAWEQWIAHLEARRRPGSLKQLLGAQRCQPLLWSWPHELLDSPSHRLAFALEKLRPNSRRVNRRLVNDLEAWLEETRSRSADKALALESLAWVHALPALSQILPAGRWMQLLEHLVDLSRDAGGADLSDPVTQQLLAGELPFTLAYLFPELPACEELAERGARTLSAGLMDLLDGEGTLHSRYLSDARALLACWTRCQYLGQAAEQPAFHLEAQEQFEWFVTQCLRTSRSDGAALFSNPAVGKWSPVLFEAALSAVGDAQDRAMANCLLPGQRPSQPARLAKLEVSLQSEWSQLAVLRGKWKRTAEQFAVAYHDQQFRVELNCGHQRLFDGTCRTELQVNGQMLTQESEWEDVCWQANERVVYLELEARFVGGWTIQRQVLLARDDRFLLLSDAVLGNACSAVSHRQVWPLAAGVTWQPALETREGFLTSGHHVAAALPLHFPEWRSQRIDGTLAASSAGLELHTCSQAQRLYVPLFVDLDPRRSLRALTWRRLTVGERLETVGNDIAAGYRVQIGKQQWLIYRSLAPRSGRTVLGQNFNSEFVCGRFSKSGETDELLEIE